ncbi:uncharacterized protein N7496_006534 [Penicillium cataractarum]|uniref:Uncharacterized protein n=1 Tax=Penicillium cataractarum TaxID=2100454 RepID=A0A9W9S2F8_9EURO|nr:uncharacterized protein N7496_006534 [Penicillium cataractarum]KAJ5370442.1 hypothetical protein N7496_006534 [Penicillium cataractarum]
MTAASANPKLPPPPSQLVYLTNLNARYNAADHAGSARPKKNFSRHRSHDDSRRLSDIGEEMSPARSEVFDDAQASQHQQQRHAQGSRGSPLPRSRSQLAISENQDSGNAARSNSSSSTVSARSGCTSGEASSPQTAPETSPNVNAVESANKNGTGDGVKTGTGLPDSSIVASAVKGKGPGEEFSSAILSSEAERILENAKKRLTLMEGNLNRARSAVRLTPSPSPSAPGSTSPMGLHPGGLYRSISKADRKGSALRRQSFVPSQDGSTNRHSRVHSETNFPAESSLSSDTKRVSRSVSAMGSSSTSNFHNDDRSFRYEPTRSYLTHRASISSIRPPHLLQIQSPKSAQSPVSAGSPVIQSPVIREDSSSCSSPRGLGILSEDDSKSNGGDFSPVYSSFGPPSRAQSQLQVRDLQYQMKGLHIKISSLKVRTQEDNMRRRSLQSLRTPSPLTAADPWYQNGLEVRDGRSSRGSNPRRDGSSEYVRETQSRQYTETASKDRKGSYNHERIDDSPVEQSPHLAQGTGESWQGHDIDYDGRESAAETMYEDAEEGDYYDDGDIDREALNEILREPLDADLATPHEEREDAFDYEHFILHSALGNFSQQMRHDSVSSHGSVETTRPTHSVRHSRTNSSLSASTDATFATATEGEPMPDDEDDILYWDRKFNHELRHRHHGQHANAAIETDRSATPRGSREDTNATPVEVQQSPARSVDMTGRSTAGSATPTSLVSSLVSTVRAASSPHPGSATPTAGGINDDDTQMLEQLFSSLGKVCMDLQAITTSPDPDSKAARVLRRRLDAARRVLDGELDA